MSPAGDIRLGVAVDAGGGTVTARQAGGLRDLALQVDPETIGVKGALQHLAKAVNIAFQTDFGENYLESVYQAAIVRNGELRIVIRRRNDPEIGWILALTEEVNGVPGRDLVGRDHLQGTLAAVRNVQRDAKYCAVGGWRTRGRWW